MPPDDLRPSLRRLAHATIALLDRLDADPDDELGADDEPDADDVPTPQPARPTPMESTTSRPADTARPRSRLTTAVTNQHRLVTKMDNRLVAAEAVAMAATAFAQHPGAYEALQATSLALDERTPEAAAEFLAASGTSALDMHAAIALLDGLTAAVIAWFQHITPWPAAEPRR